MAPLNYFKFLGLLSSLALTIGCNQPAGNMQDMSGPPPRPAELDELNPWVGTWNNSSEMTMYGPEGEQKMTSTGKETARWACDNRIIVSEMEFDMGEMGKMSGLSVMTWDKKAGKYRSFWFDSWGTIGEGEMWKDAKTGEWMMKSRGSDPMTGEATAGKGSIKLIDANNMEWSFVESDSWGFKKKMEMKGTSKRQ